jgi:1,4-alpha-glucan branching enzyme
MGGGAKSLPKPAGVPSAAAGLTRLSIAARDARRVELAGDFTQWTFTPAQRAANGVWYVDLAVAPGRYRYAFRVDGTEWRTPEGAATADDGFGGKSALLTIERSTTGRNSR